MGKPLVRILLAGAFACAWSFAVGAQTVAEVKRLPSTELAEQLLPPDLAAGVRSHEWSNDAMLPKGMTPTGITFFTHPVPDGEHLCRRTAIFVSLRMARIPDGGVLAPGWLKSTGHVKSEQIAVYDKCPDLVAARFANVQNADVADAKTLLLTLRNLQRRNKLRLRDDLRLFCKSDFERKKCRPDPYSVFAGLPLEKAYIIEGPNDEDRFWTLAVMPLGPGNIFWEVRAYGSPASPTRIFMRWTMPAPF